MLAILHAWVKANGPFEVSPREALAAPTTDAETYIQSIVILTLGLAISDWIMAINFLSSSAMDVSGHLIGEPDLEGFCSFNGFMTQVFVVQTDYWVLTIAICTYVILADHKHISCWVQENCRQLMAIPWVFSVIWASIGLGVAGYGDIGAWCWFTSDEVRLLVNFVPRWIIIAIMLAMYTRLYLVLYRAHSPFSSSHESTTDDLSRPSGTWDSATPNGRRIKKMARLMLMYPVAYIFVWTLPTAIRIYQASKGVSAPFALQTIDKACIVIQGFVDALIYGVTEPSLSHWRNLLFPKPIPTTDGIILTYVTTTGPLRVTASRLSDGESTTGLKTTITAKDSRSSRDNVF
ncbi:uncharacterized protein N7496_007860 [Penicillium cataractarum]|uniref:G-protein coupled receptors family 2 profile 2 domain-containing protein n=1 Tax=Penicillium cataractarum TaxID=2100454 RepID=A0A9W9RYP0_9EURO|nr:uncharacterized protein N7496_007860 [Penicillium cataractarum]KAJ5368100.1 hypothetical protein N7496_007860 [Penicillium cataractarum]